MTDTIVFGYQKKDRIDFCVIFYNTTTGERKKKYIKNLKQIAAYQDYCLLISQVDEQQNTYVLVLCNAVGSPVDSKWINIEPTSVAMSNTHIIICSKYDVYTWQYSVSVDQLASTGYKRKVGREVAFFIDDEPNPNSIYDKKSYLVES